MDMNNLLDEFNNIIYTYGPKLLGAIAVLIIGNYIIKIINKWLYLIQLLVL